MGLQRTSMQPPCPDYIGRISENKQLQQEYQANEFSESIDILVHGPPGVGKTELVYKFLQSSEVPESRVIWIHTASKQFIIESLKRESDKLNITEEDLVELSRKIYSKHVDTDMGKTVLVFDEVLSHADLKDFLPPREFLPHIFIIVTSVNSTLQAHRTIGVQYFSDIEAVDFVKRSIKDEDLVTKICSEMKIGHGNIPVILSNLSKSIISDVSKKDNVVKLETSVTENVLDFLQEEITILSLDQPYNKQTDKMFDVPLNLVETFDNGQDALKVLKMISTIDCEIVPCTLFKQPKYQTGIKILSNFSMIKLRDDNIISNSFLRLHCRKMFASELRDCTQEVLNLFKNKIVNNKFTSSVYTDPAIQTWKTVVQYPDCVTRAASLGIAILNSKEVKIKNKTIFISKYVNNIICWLQENTENEDVLKLLSKFLIVFYKSADYAGATECIDTFLNLSYQSPTITRAQAFQIFVKARTPGTGDCTREFENFFNQEIGLIQHWQELAKSLRDASFLFTKEDDFITFQECWCKLAQDKNVSTM